MMSVGHCNHCKNSKTNILKELCEHCVANAKRVVSSRKRYSSSTSTKSGTSGISGLSAETQLTSINDDEDEVECDGPGSDYDADGEQDRTERKTIQFDLDSTESLTSKRYVNPIGPETHRNCQGCSRNKSFPSFNPANLTSMQRTRLMEQHQNQRKRTPRTRRNVSESEVGSFYGRRFSADDENLIEFIQPFPHDTFVQVDEHHRRPPRTYLARVPLAKSDPNLQRVYTNKENVYDSVQDNDSGYVQNNFKAEFIRNNSAKSDNAKYDANKSQWETCLQTPRKFIIIVIVTILVSWAPVAILTGLLVSSVHNKGPGTTTPPTEHPDIEDYIRAAVDRRHPGSRIRSAPLRLEGTGLTSVPVNDHTHFRFQWNVAEHFVQNPLSLHSDKVMINVTQTGYYFVFCRIYYIGEKSSTRPFTVQHSLYKVNGDPNHQMLDSVSQHCMMMDNPQIEHTSTLETIVHLTAGSQIYIRLSSDAFINRKDFSQNVMGIFLLS